MDLTVSQLQKLLMAECDKGNGDKPVRIGDQIEAGPYSHAEVGGIFIGDEGAIILCANDDAPWQDEVTERGSDLPVLVWGD